MPQPVAPAVGDQAAAAWAAGLIDWTDGAATAFTPTLTATTTNPTLGSGSNQIGLFAQSGQLVAGHGTIVFGTGGTAAGSGVYLVNLPTAVNSALVVGTLVGTCTLKCAGLFTRGDLYLNNVGSSICRMVYTSAAVGGSYVSSAAGAPGAWTANDSIQYTFQYVSA